MNPFVVIKVNITFNILPLKGVKGVLNRIHHFIVICKALMI